MIKIRSNVFEIYDIFKNFLFNEDVTMRYREIMG